MAFLYGGHCSTGICSNWPDCPAHGLLRAADSVREVEDVQNNNRWMSVISAMYVEVSALRAKLLREKPEVMAELDAYLECVGGADGAVSVKKVLLVQTECMRKVAHNPYKYKMRYGCNGSCGGTCDECRSASLKGSACDCSSHNKGGMIGGPKGGCGGSCGGGKKASGGGGFWP